MKKREERKVKKDNTKYAEGKLFFLTKNHHIPTEPPSPYLVTRETEYC